MPKINYQVRTWNVMSDHDKNKTYLIREMPEGLRCSCPAGVFRGICKHTKKIWVQIDAEKRARRATAKTR